MSHGSEHGEVRGRLADSGGSCFLYRQSDAAEKQHRHITMTMRHVLPRGGREIFQNNKPAKNTHVIVIIKVTTQLCFMRLLLCELPEIESVFSREHDEYECRSRQEQYSGLIQLHSLEYVLLFII